PSLLRAIAGPALCLGSLGAQSIPWIQEMSAARVAVSPDGVYVTKYNRDLGCLRRLDFQGNVLWSDNSRDSGCAIFSTGSFPYSGAGALAAVPGAVYVLGHPLNIGGVSFLKKFDLNGTLIWTVDLVRDASTGVDVAADATAVYLARAEFSYTA